MTDEDWSGVDEALNWDRLTKAQRWQLGMTAHRVRIAKIVIRRRAAATLAALRPFVCALADLLVADLTRQPRIG